MKRLRHFLQSISFTTPVFIGCLLGAGFLLFYRLSDLMDFFSDAGWFYLAARDMLLGKGIPLVSITASHTWLHQGPFWTYMLAGALWLGKFQPIAGAYLAVSIGLFTVAMMYLLGKQMFSENVALISALLYATSPLALIHARMPYHTTPIPLFTLLYFWAIFKFLNGHKNYFPLIFLFLAILYNFELATVMLVAPLVMIFAYGIWQKARWIRTLGKKDISLAVITGFIPMLPVILYDLTHGYKQTIVYAGWLVYNALRALGLPFLHKVVVAQPINIFQFTFMLLQRLLFLPNGIVALLLLAGAVVFAGIRLYQQFEAKNIDTALLLVALWFAVSAILYFGNRTPSEAYVPIFFPAIFFLLAHLFAFVISKQKLVGLLCLVFLMGLNVNSLLSHNYLMDEANGYGPTFADREEIMRKVLNTVHGGKYKLIGLGKGSQFASFLMPYSYLGWYYGNAPSNKARNVFIIEENDTGITLLEKQTNTD